MAVVHVDAMIAQRGVEPRCVLAISARQQLLRSQIVEFDGVVSCEPVARADDKVKVFGKKRPGVQSFPARIELGRDAKLGLALFEEITDLTAVAAEEAKFQPVEM